MALITEQQQNQKEGRRHFKGGGRQHKCTEKFQPAPDIKTESQPQQDLFDQVNVAGDQVEKYGTVEGQQTEKVKDKIDYVLYLVTNADKIPKKFFDSMTGYKGLFEIKIELESNIFRIFCCFDKGDLIILFNGFQKKTQKTPKKEIEKALRIKNEYFKQKEKGSKK